MKRSLLSILAFIIVESVWAQCAQNIRLAQSTYEDGRLHEIYSILKPCLNSSDITKAEKVQALKLLTETYIYLEEPAKADSCMLEMLRADPNTKVDESVDPPEFKALYETFRTNPIYRYGAKVGVNLTGANISDQVKVTDGSGKYKSAVNFQAGAAFEVPLTQENRFIFNPELYFILRNLKSTLTTELPEGNNITTESESQRWISLPISLQYNILYKQEKEKELKFHPYVSLGVSTDYLISSEITLDRTRIEHSPVSEKNLTPTRNKVNVGAIASAGVKLKMGGGYFITEVRLLYSLTQTNSVSTALDNEQMALDYAFANSPYKLTALALTVGYVQNVFNPKKLFK